MRFSSLIVAALVALSCAAGNAAAQSSQIWSLQGSFITYTPYGEVFSDVDMGTGFEVQARYTPGALSFGGGIQFTSHEIWDLDAPVDIVGVFVEPRYVLDLGSNHLALYLSARLASSLLSIAAYEAESFGVTINGGGGALVRVSPRVNLDLGATYGYTNWGDFTVGGESVGVLGGGTNVVTRVGLAIGLGR